MPLYFEWDQPSNAISPMFQNSRIKTSSITTPGIWSLEFGFWDFKKVTIYPASIKEMF